MSLRVPSQNLVPETRLPDDRALEGGVPAWMLAGRDFVAPDFDTGGRFGGVIWHTGSSSNKRHSWKTIKAQVCEGERR